MVRNETYSPKLLALRRCACISGQYKLTWSQITGMDPSERQSVDWQHMVVAVLLALSV